MELTSFAVAGLLGAGMKVIWEKVGDQAIQDAYEKFKGWLSKKPELKEPIENLAKNPHDTSAELQLLKALEAHKAHFDEELARLAKDFEEKLARSKSLPQAANQAGVNVQNSNDVVIASGANSNAARGNITIHKS